MPSPFVPPPPKRGPVHSEYEESYAYRGMPPRDPPAPAPEYEPRKTHPDHYHTTNETNYKPIDPEEYRKALQGHTAETDPQQPEHVDPDMYKSSNAEAYKPIDPEEYRKALQGHEEEDEPVQPRKADPDMYKSSAAEAYKPIDPAAYPKRDAQEGQAQVQPRKADPDMYKSTNAEAYKPIDPAAYPKRYVCDDRPPVAPRPGNPDMYKSTNKDTYGLHPLDLAKVKRGSDARSRQGSSRLNTNRSSRPKATGRSARSGIGSTPSTARSVMTSRRNSARGSERDFVVPVGRHGGSGAPPTVPVQLTKAAPDHFLTTKNLDYSAPPKESYVAADGPRGPSKPVQPRKVDPDHFKSTTKADYPPHKPTPRSSPARRGSVGAFGLAPDTRDFSSEYRAQFPKYDIAPTTVAKAAAPRGVSHVDPSFYTTTASANYPNHWSNKA